MAGILKVDQIEGSGLSGDITIPTGFRMVADAGGLASPGQIINVAQWSTNAVGFWSTSGFTLVDSLNYTYSPVGSNSKILITWDHMMGTSNNNSHAFKLSVNGTFPFVGLNNGSVDGGTGPNIYINNTSASIHSFSGKYLYQNSGTDSVVLKAYFYSQGGGIYLNRGYSYDDSARSRTISAWTILEVAQ